MKNATIVILLAIVLLTSACMGKDSTPSDVGNEVIDKHVDTVNDNACSLACWDRTNMPKDACEREAWLKDRPGLRECTCGKYDMQQVYEEAMEACAEQGGND